MPVSANPDGLGEVLRVPLCLTCYRIRDLARFFDADDRLRLGGLFSVFDAPADAGLGADEAGGPLGAVASWRDCRS